MWSPFKPGIIESVKEIEDWLDKGQKIYIHCVPEDQLVASPIPQSVTGIEIGSSLLAGGRVRNRVESHTADIVSVTTAMCGPPLRVSADHSVLVKRAWRTGNEVVRPTRKYSIEIG